MTGYLYGAMFEIEERLRMAARLGLDCRLAPADCRAILRELARLNREARTLAVKLQEGYAPTN